MKSKIIYDVFGCFVCGFTGRHEGYHNLHHCKECNALLEDSPSPTESHKRVCEGMKDRSCEICDKPIDPKRYAEHTFESIFGGEVYVETCLGCSEALHSQRIPIPKPQGLCYIPLYKWLWELILFVLVYLVFLPLLGSIGPFWVLGMFIHIVVRLLSLKFFGF